MRIFVLCLLMAILGTGCASTAQHRPGDFVAPVHRSLLESPDVVQAFQVTDSWESFNRRMYRFNAQMDRYFFLPIVTTYEEITPFPVRKGVSNFFNNLKEVPIFLNSILQGKPKKASVSLSRFIFNTTLGLGGIIDILGNDGIPQENEDFGQTLATWGLPRGPYLVLPVFGPSGLRDALGLPVDIVATPGPLGLFVDAWGWAGGTSAAFGFYSLKAVDARSQVKFRYYETGSPFEYQLVRFMYTKKRELDCMK